LITRRTAVAALAGVPAAFGAKYRVEKLWKSPDGNPNALEATPEGLWVGEQVTDRAYLLDWKTGKVLHKVDTESSNTSGIAYGGGFIWMGANGKATFRKPKPTDATSGEVIKVDPKTGHTVARYPNPDGGGLHGLLYDKGTIWMTCFKWQVLAQVDAKTFEIKRKVPVALGRAHGLALDGDAIWCVFSNDFVIQKIALADGKVVDEIKLNKETDPDPHGMDMYKGEMYYCDAGIAPGPKFTDLPSSGYVSKIIRL
jgi:outer membrane protein assembly factor BamB